MSGRPLTDREALLPVAALLAELILMAATGTLLLGGWRTLAGYVALVGLPVAGIGLASTVWVLIRMLEAMADIRRQREAEPSSGEGTPDEEGTP